MSVYNTIYNPVNFAVHRLVYQTGSRNICYDCHIKCSVAYILLFVFDNVNFNEVDHQSVVRSLVY